MTDLFKTIYDELVYPSLSEFIRKFPNKKKEAEEFWKSLPENQVFRDTFAAKSTKEEEAQRRNVSQGFKQRESNKYDYQIVFDLMDMSRFKRLNRGHAWILTAIEKRSRYAWAIPVKTKKAVDIADAFETIIKQLKASAWISLISDDGNEFKGEFKKMIERYQSIKGIVVEKKIDRTTLGGNRVVYASQVERFNRTILQKLRKVFVATNSNNWIDSIAAIVKNYNKDKALPELREAITYDLTDRPIPIAIGDYVRVRQSTNLFEKKSLALKYSREYYQITEIDGIILTAKDPEGTLHKFEYIDLIKVPKPSGSVEISSADVAKNKVINKTKQLLSREGIKARDEVKAIEDDGTVIFKKRLATPAKALDDEANPHHLRARKQINYSDSFSSRGFASTAKGRITKKK